MNEEGFGVRGGTFAGGPSQRQKNYATSFHEQDSLISSYEHLTGLPDPGDALHRLRKIASLVKPIMRKRGWHVGTLTEFLPEDQRLLGLNINRGQKICVRLRYSHRPSSFLPIEQCVDTMLHELSHIIFGPHDAQFHALWDELRNEHETLLMRGYTGEGFLTKGKRLGGGPTPPPAELRRLARQNAENRRRQDKTRTPSGGSRLGGSRIVPGQDPRKVIADAIERRNVIDRGCASGSSEADHLARQPSQRTIMTKAEEDDANNRAIAEAILELMEEEERQKLDGVSGAVIQGLTWDPKTGLSAQGPLIRRTPSPIGRMSEEDQIKWAMQESMKTIPTSREVSAEPEMVRAGPAGESSGSSEPGSSEPGSSEPGTSRQKKRSRDSSHARTVREGQRPDDNHLANLACAIGAATSPAVVRDDQHDAAQLSGQSEPISLTDQPRPGTRVPSVPPLRVDSMEANDEQNKGASMTWTCEICTCINPAQFLACDACCCERPASVIKRANTAAGDRRSRQPFHADLDGRGRPRSTGADTHDGDRRSLLDRSAVANLERIQRQSVGLAVPTTLGWSCRRCTTFMEHKYWTCSLCGLMKGDSRASEHVG